MEHSADDSDMLSACIFPTSRFSVHEHAVTRSVAACSGVAYLASTALSPLKAQLVVVIYVLVAVMFSGLETHLSTLEKFVTALENPLGNYLCIGTN
jgi:hypothetical protein